MRNLRPRWDRLAVVAWSLAAVLVLATTMGAARLVGRTSDVYESSWRGRYDILVTAPGLEKALSPGTDQQGLPLLDPNFANVTTPTMPLEDVERIRGTHGVEVAAPIGFLGSTGNVLNFPLFFVPWSELPDSAAEFRIRWQITSDDGLGKKVIMDRTNSIRLDYSEWNREIGAFADVGVRFETDDKRFTLEGGVSPGGLEFGWRPVTVPRSSVFAVDPVAEAALLGESGGFLEPLTRFDEVTREFGPVTVNNIGRRDDGELDPTVPVQAKIAEFPGSLPGQRAALWGAYGLDSPFVGFLRNAAPQTTMDLHVGAERLSDSGAEHVGDLHLDLAKAGKPFNSGELEIGWPTGDQQASQDVERYVVPRYSSFGVSPLELQASSRDGAPQGAAFEVAPQGFEAAIPQLAEKQPDGTAAGDEQTYRRQVSAQLNLGVYAEDKVGAAPFEVGTYLPQDLDAGTSYVPLGAYDPARVTVSSSGQALTPTRNGMGLAAQASSAIVSLNGASQLVDGDFVSAVRVRVAGLEGLPRTDAMPRIDAVAAELRTLGLDVFVVAGASLQPVSLWVPDYAFGTTDAAVPQRVGDLGWVSQEFTTLGAVTWSETTTTQVVLLLFAGAITTAGILLVGVGWLSRPRRTADHTLLASLGWSHPARFRWTVQTQWPGLVLTTAAGLAGLLMAPSGLRWPVVGFLVLVVAAVAASHPLHPPVSSLAARLGSRWRIIGLALSETLLAGLAAATFALIGAGVGWYRQVTTNTRVATAVGEVFTSFIIVAALLIVAVAVIQAATTRLGEQARGRRARFRYWHLGTPRRALVTRHLLSSALMLAGALLPSLVVLFYAHKLAIPVTLAAILSAGWLVLWIMLRAIAAISWRP